MNQFEFILDETTDQMLADLDQAMTDAQRQAAAQAAAPFVNQLRGILQLTMRLNKLDGDWHLSETADPITGRRRLVKDGAPTPNITQKNPQPQKTKRNRK